MAKKYRAGFVFKLGHTEVHYMRTAKIDGRKKYANNFTTNVDEAYIFDNKEDFEEHLLQFIDKANHPDRNDGYHFCPVSEIVN